MTAEGKYGSAGFKENEYEPDSRRRVLANRLGIRRTREMDKAEFAAQVRALDALAGLYGPRKKFKALDIRQIHSIWLGDIYDWAGTYRNVNVSKDGFHFAAAVHVPNLMQELAVWSAQRAYSVHIQESRASGAGNS